MPLAEKAASALPKATVSSSTNTTVDDLFERVWVNLPSKLKKLVNTYRQSGDESNEAFHGALQSVYAKLDLGPDLPSSEIIMDEASGPGLSKWHADKRHKLRVNISTAFEALDSCLDSSFDLLREEILNVFLSEDGGMLGSWDDQSKKKLPWTWQDILDRWQGHASGGVICRIIQRLQGGWLVVPRLHSAENPTMS